MFLVSKENGRAFSLPEVCKDNTMTIHLTLTGKWPTNGHDKEKRRQKIPTQKSSNILSRPRPVLAESYYTPNESIKYSSYQAHFSRLFTYLAILAEDPDGNRDDRSVDHILEREDKLGQDGRSKSLHKESEPERAQH